MSEPSPINPLPPVITAIAVIIVGLELLFSAGQSGLLGGAEALGWRSTAIENYGFSGPLFMRMLELGVFPGEQMIRFVSYPFIHGGWMHVIFVVVFLLALGKVVGEIFSWWSVLVVFFTSAIGGALAYALILDDPFPLIGSFPAVYGIIGAYTFLMWVSLGAMGENQAQAFTLIGLLLAFQLGFGLLFGARNDWVADLAGFATGFLTSVVVSPGGFARLLARLRKR